MEAFGVKMFNENICSKEDRQAEKILNAMTKKLVTDSKLDYLGGMKMYIILTVNR